MLTINSTILAGTVIKIDGDAQRCRFLDDFRGDPHAHRWQWLVFGTEPQMELQRPTGPLSFGDEIYIFQASSTENPLLNVSRFIYALDFGDNGSGTGMIPRDKWPRSFSRGGNIPDGTVSTNPLLGSGVYITVPTISDQTNGDPNDNTAVGLDSSVEYFNGTFALDLTNGRHRPPDIDFGTKEEWLALINNTGHWSSASSIFDNTGAFAGGLNFTGVPEPTRALLLALGAALRDVPSASPVEFPGWRWVRRFL